MNIDRPGHTAPRLPVVDKMSNASELPLPANFKPDPGRPQFANNAANERRRFDFTSARGINTLTPLPMERGKAGATSENFGNIAELSDSQICANHDWLNQLKSISVGFNTSAPGSGHIGASMEVLRKLVACTDQPKLGVVFDDDDSEKTQKLKLDIQREFPGRVFVDKSDTRSDLLVFGGLDGSGSPHIAGKYQTMAKSILVMQPPYFKNHPPVLYVGNERKGLNNLTDHHIFTSRTDTANNTLHDTDTSFVVKLKSLAPDAQDYALLYDGGTGTILQLEKMVEALNQLETPSVCVVINKKRYEQQQELESPAENNGICMKKMGNVTCVFADRLPQSQFRALIDECTLPSIVGGANSANEFQIRNKPFLFEKGVHFTGGFSNNPGDSSPYQSHIPQKISFDGMYPGFKQGKFKTFYETLQKNANPNRDRFEVALHEARAQLSGA